MWKMHSLFEPISFVFQNLNLGEQEGGFGEDNRKIKHDTARVTSLELVFDLHVNNLF